MKRKYILISLLVVFFSNTISAYVTILRQPSFGTQLGEAFGSGLGEGIRQLAVDLYNQREYERRAQLALKLQKKEHEQRLLEQEHQRRLLEQEHQQRLLEQERQRRMIEKAHKEQLKQDKIRYGLLFIFMLVFLFTILLILKHKRNK